MRSEKIQIDRGVQLDQMRLRGAFVDVRFVVDGVKHPAHRFIVGLHSPVLRMLTFSNKNAAQNNLNEVQTLDVPCFIESGRDEIELKGLTSSAFESVLTYLYTGTLLLTEDNVFNVIETCQFLQIEDKHLTDTFGKYLTTLIQGVSCCDVTMLLKVWCLAEQFSWSHLSEIVLRVIDSKLELFLNEDLFLYLGYEEIKAILQRPTLCLRSEKFVFDALIDWAGQKISSEDPENQSLALQLFQLLKVDHLKKSYVVDSLSSIGFDKTALKFCRQQKRTCKDCIYISLFSRCETEIRGIDEFLEQRKSELEFTYLDLNSENIESPHNGPVSLSWKPIHSMTKSKTYFQHYGPHEGLRGSVFLTTERELYLFGCQKNSSISSLDGLSNEIKVFDYATQCWLRCMATMPKRLSDFGLIYVKDEIYLIGGLTDRSSPTKERLAMGRSSGRALNISTDVFKIKASVLREGLKNLRQVSWIPLSEMTNERSGFSVANVDASKLFVVGKDFCDVYNIESDTWTSISVPFSSSEQQSQAVGRPKPGSSQLTETSKPVVAAMGSNIFVFGERPHGGGVNGAWILDVHSYTWSKLISSLDMRYDPKGAFSHNGLIYLFGWQAATNNFVFSFDPQSKKWTIIIKNNSGNLTSSGVFVRKSFFDNL